MRYLLALGAALAAGPLAAQSASPAATGSGSRRPFDRIISFGDSLSDVGA